MVLEIIERSEGPAGNSCRPFGSFSFFWFVDPELTVGAIGFRRFAPLDSWLKFA